MPRSFLFHARGRIFSLAQPGLETALLAGRRAPGRPDGRRFERLARVSEDLPDRPWPCCNAISQLSPPHLGHSSVIPVPVLSRARVPDLELGSPVRRRRLAGPRGLIAPAAPPESKQSGRRNLVRGGAASPRCSSPLSLRAAADDSTLIDRSFLCQKRFFADGEIPRRWSPAERRRI